MLLFFLCCQLTLLLVELGAPFQDASIAAIVAIWQIFGGLLTWRAVAGVNRLELSEVALGIGLGVLLFGLLASFVHPVAALMFPVPAATSLIIRRRWHFHEMFPTPDLLRTSRVFELMLLVSAIQFLFLSQWRPRFLLAGVLVFIAHVLFSAASRSLTSQLPILRRTINGGAFAVLGIVHLFMLLKRDVFSILDSKVIFSQDAVTQAAMSRGIIEFGPFDSVLLAGVQDRYHWLSWGWAGGMGHLMGGEYWLSTEVVILGVVAFSVSLILVRLADSPTKSSVVIALALVATLMVDSSLENAPSVDFGGTSGFFGLLGLAMLIPLVNAWDRGLVRKTIAATLVTISFGVLAKVSFGLLLATAICFVGLFEMIKKRKYSLSIVVFVLSAFVIAVCYKLFLGPFSQTENPSFAIRPSIEILGYQPVELVDLGIRIVPFGALLWLQALKKTRLNFGVSFAVAAGLFLLLMLDLRNSGPISFVWATSFLIGLAVMTTEDLKVSIGLGALSVPAFVFGVWTSFRLVSLQWSGQAVHESQITLLLWLGFSATISIPLISSIVGRGQARERCTRGATALLVVSIAYCSGSFVVQTMRTEVRELADSRAGIERDPILFGKASTEKFDVVRVAEWIRNNSTSQELFASDDRYLGSFIASIAGRRAYVASDHSYFSHPEEYVRRQEIVESFLTSGSLDSRKEFACKGVTFLVREDSSESSSSLPNQVAFQAGRFIVNRLDQEKSLKAFC